MEFPTIKTTVGLLTILSKRIGILMEGYLAFSIKFLYWALLNLIFFSFIEEMFVKMIQM